MEFSYLGYSERGMINAICHDIARAENPLEPLREFISWFGFPGWNDWSSTEITNATVLVEQSFADFGDLDLLILLEAKSEKRLAILVEAKVSTDTVSWQTLRHRWEEFGRMLDDAEGNTSNLFVQLHRKMLLVAYLRDSDQAVIDRFLPRGSLGRNRVVNRAREQLAEYVNEKGNEAWFGALVPDDPDAVDSFLLDSLNQPALDEASLQWQLEHLRFLSWEKVQAWMQKNKQMWMTAEACFEWNKGQIFHSRPHAGDTDSLQAGHFYSWNGNPVYVVDPGRGKTCGVVRHIEANLTFGKYTNVKIGELRPDAASASMIRPLKPLRGVQYLWKPERGEPEAPNCYNNECRPNAPCTVVVRSPGWEASGVEVGGTRFHVYTHHLTISNAG